MLSGRSLCWLATVLILPFARAPLPGFVCPEDVATGRSIPLEWLDDDYCDCVETGRDELHTAACGHLQQAAFACDGGTRLIPHSWLHDGVLDCADESDERAIVRVSTSERLPHEFAAGTGTELQTIDFVNDEAIDGGVLQMVLPCSASRAEAEQERQASLRSKAMELRQLGDAAAHASTMAHAAPFLRQLAASFDHFVHARLVREEGRQISQGIAVRDAQEWQQYRAVWLDPLGGRRHPHPPRQPNVSLQQPNLAVRREVSLTELNSGGLPFNSSYLGRAAAALVQVWLALVTDFAVTYDPFWHPLLYANTTVWDVVCPASDAILREVARPAAGATCELLHAVLELDIVTRIATITKTPKQYAGVGAPDASQQWLTLERDVDAALTTTSTPAGNGPRRDTGGNAAEPASVRTVGQKHARKRGASLLGRWLQLSAADVLIESTYTASRLIGVASLPVQGALWLLQQIWSVVGYLWQTLHAVAATACTRWLHLSPTHTAASLGQAAVAPLYRWLTSQTAMHWKNISPIVRVPIQTFSRSVVSWYHDVLHFRLCALIQVADTAGEWLLSKLLARPNPSFTRPEVSVLSQVRASLSNVSTQVHQSVAAAAAVTNLQARINALLVAQLPASLMERQGQGTEIASLAWLASVWYHNSLHARQHGGSGFADGNAARAPSCVNTSMPDAAIWAEMEQALHLTIVPSSAGYQGSLLGDDRVNNATGSSEITATMPAISSLPGSPTAVGQIQDSTVSVDGFYSIESTPRLQREQTGTTVVSWLTLPFVLRSERSVPAPCSANSPHSSPREGGMNAAVQRVDMTFVCGLRGGSHTPCAPAEATSTSSTVTHASCSVAITTPAACWSWQRDVSSGAG